MSPLIVVDWTPDMAGSSMAADLPVLEAGGSRDVLESEETPKRRNFGGSQPRRLINYPGSSIGGGTGAYQPPSEAASVDLSLTAAALLSLGNGPRPVRQKTSAAATGDRARPGPRPQSKYMGVTRHVKGMWNAQLWLAGQTRQEHVGGFATTEAAAAAHDLAALTIKGIADARTNFPLSTYDGLIDDLKGLDWPALRLAIKAIVKDKLDLPALGSASPSETPGALRPLLLPSPTVPSRNERDKGGTSTPPNVTPAKRARSEGSSEPSISELTGASGTPSPGDREVPPPENVRKSGRAREIPGRLMALNGEDPKLSHNPTKKRRRNGYSLEVD